MPGEMLIVGAGEAGVRAAFTLREAGWSGAVRLIGAEAGLPYERPPLSKSMASDAPPRRAEIAQAAAFAEADIIFMPDSYVTTIDRDERVASLGDGRLFTYEKLLLATGAKARALPVDGGEMAMLLRTDKDALAISERLKPGARIGIVGGGFIGLELAACAADAGCQVTVFEAADDVMGRVVPPLIAGFMAARHRDAGVDIKTGFAIAGVEARDNGFAIIGPGVDVFEVDVIIAGVGAAPHIELAADAGLDIENGIRTDKLLRTSDPHIFAAGDCASFPHPIYGNRHMRLESWRNAQAMGEFAARAMLGARTPYDEVPWFWSDQYDLTLQIAGVPGWASKTIARDIGTDAILLFGVTADGRLVSASGVGLGNRVAKDIRLAQMLIAQQAHPALDDLANPLINLKKLLSR